MGWRWPKTSANRVKLAGIGIRPKLLLNTCQNGRCKFAKVRVSFPSSSINCQQTFVLDIFACISSNSMDPWDFEVEAGWKDVVYPGSNNVYHLSGVALGSSEKTSKDVVVHAMYNEKKWRIGVLSEKNGFQIACDLKFKGKFGVCHNSKSATVRCIGYRTTCDDQDMDEDNSPAGYENHATSKMAGKRKRRSFEADTEFSAKAMQSTQTDG